MTPLGRRCKRDVLTGLCRARMDGAPIGYPTVSVVRTGVEVNAREANEKRPKMEARIDIITLAVSDLERALDFYREGLELESRGVIGTEFAGDDVEPAGAIALFELRNGLLLSLYPRTELAKDAKVPLGPPKSGEFSIGYAVAGKAEVDALLTQAQAAGATLTDQPHDRPWGIYSGYFRDPDGHLWEILWNPRLVRPQE
jgi:catechol 2,3-dioxygenase-like lactoylglutathione lyase family enzyme